MEQNRRKWLRKIWPGHTITIFLILLAGFQVKGHDTKAVIVTKSGLRYTVLRSGSGDVPKPGQEVAVYESMGYLRLERSGN